VIRRGLDLVGKAALVVAGAAFFAAMLLEPKRRR
jgi:hypothetical protein